MRVGVRGVGVRVSGVVASFGLFAALAWFLINDRIKLLAYRVLERSRGKAKGQIQPAAIS